MTLYGYDGFDGADFGDMGEDYVQMGARGKKKRKAPRPAGAPAAAPAAAPRAPMARKQPPRRNPRLANSQTNYHPLSLQQMGEDEMGAFVMPQPKTLLMIAGGLVAAWYYFGRK